MTMQGRMDLHIHGFQTSPESCNDAAELLRTVNGFVNPCPQKGDDGALHAHLLPF